MSEKSRFAWWGVTLFAMGVTCVIALNLLQQNDLIDKQTEGLLRLVINGGLGVALVIQCLRSPMSRLLRNAIVVTVVAANAETLLNYTEDVPQLNHLPVLGHDSAWRPTIESILGAGWMCGGFTIMYAAILSVQRGRTELRSRVDALSRSENELLESNARLAATLQQLRQTQQQLVQRERLSALGQMASGVAHDLNNSLSPVVTYAQLLSDSPHQLSAEQTLWIECIERCSLDAVATIEGLQHFYQQDPDAATRGVVSLAELIRQVVDATRPKWKSEPERQGFQIETKLELHESPYVLVNAAEFRVALTNLLFNAVEAMPAGGTLTLDLDCIDGDVVLSIADTGAGMSPECLERCFEPFYTSKSRGSGLGLSVCHGVIQRSGGTLDVESTCGVGTVFRIRLPLAMPTGHVVSTPKTVKSMTPKSVRVSVLLVDDDPIVLTATRLMLESCFAEVVTAEGGAEAIAWYQQSPQIDLVMTDLGMSGIDGVQVLAAVKELRPEQTIAVISGWSEQEVNRRFAKSDRPDFVIHKPHTRDQLREMLDQVRQEKSSLSEPAIATLGLA